MMKVAAAVVFLVLLLHPLDHGFCHASIITCRTNQDCQDALRGVEGSECGKDGVCSNPFYKNGGCLKSMMLQKEGEEATIRTCSSNDNDDDYCQPPPPFDYLELRVAANNWDSAIFNAWIVQILFAELLHVPVTVETFTPDLNLDFYNPQATFGYGAYDPKDLRGIMNGVKYGDCRRLINNNNNDDDYEPCLHLFPEIWMEDFALHLPHKKNEGIVENPIELGMMATQRWFVPLHTAREYPSVVSYTGLAGQENRAKLAKLFKRPTSWAEYCNEVSTNGCNDDDGVAVRAPRDTLEGKRYNVPHLFTGHFRATQENNCSTFNNNCTGHIVDYPGCGWVSFVNQQTHHLDIALQSSGPESNHGYPPDLVGDIWRAANATRSHVMMYWFTTDALYEEFLSTDYEFTPVILPRPTQECLDNRVTPEQMCSSDDPQARIGNALGSCDTTPQILTKVIGGTIRDLTTGNPNIPEALWSPAVDAFVNYHMTSLQMGEIFSLWRERVDPRVAACQWVVDNIDLVKSFVPVGYPRVISEIQTGQTQIVRHVAMGVAAFSLLFAPILMGAVFCARRKRSIYHAQVDFLYVMLVGLTLVSVGALLMALPVAVVQPSTAVCTVIAWLSQLGYAIELPPLTLKGDAINRMASSGKRMQRVRLSKSAIYGSVLLGCLVVCGFLIAWTVTDMPTEHVTYEVTDRSNENGETIVTAIYGCASNSNLWVIFSIIWQAAILLYTLILAFMASRVREDMNGTRNLLLLLFSQCIFMGCRLATVVMAGWTDPALEAAVFSLCLSCDCTMAMFLFVLPKVCERSSKQDSDEILPDLFLNSTILIADITGFTAWSSVRDPAQVFRFLDTVYLQFDELAETRKVMKVETVRDSYIAATGVPRAQNDHAERMAKFAQDLLMRMNRLSHELEIVYGPDTCELSLRVGINSGPTIGGFMQGKGARFQLFGDTVTLAVNVERSGERGKIHVSEQTAALLIKAKRQTWLEKRDPPVRVKGKGEMTTYWLNRFASSSTVGSSFRQISSRISEADSNEDAADRILWNIAHDEEETRLSRRQRLIEWNAEVLGGLLKEIVARRNAAAEDAGLSAAVAGIESLGGASEVVVSSLNWLPKKRSEKTTSNSRSEASQTSLSSPFEGSMPLNEVVEIIHLPEFDRKVAGRVKDATSVVLPEAVAEQLLHLVTGISAMYNDNPFHSFEHASHVVQAVIKMMNRITAAADLDLGEDADRKTTSKKVAEALHDHTYGITSDPLTRFACVYSALIHDVDHPGVPNPQLERENPALAATYQGRSIAEQNSFQIGWNLLVEERFHDLQRAIFGTRNELIRLRQLIVNSVMATDLGDKELKLLRNGRWDKAFSQAAASLDSSMEPERDVVNRKATIVIEHIIQAADVSHTMQHWHVYREWNEKLFREMHYAYQAGRAEKNPADFWYDGEIGFFDFYIIPLSKKLADCGVFGVTSDENLNYAINNRAEWVAKGKEVVAEMVEKLQREEDAQQILSGSGTSDQQASRSDLL